VISAKIRRVIELEADKHKIYTEMQANKEGIAKLIVNATRNYPPTKDDVKEIMLELNKLFPELETLKKLSTNRNMEKCMMTSFWRDKIPIYDINKRIEKELKSPYCSKRAREVFALVLWLSFELLFKNTFWLTKIESYPKNLIEE
jgi:hypothetical protein